ncbi:amino acid adenylation domain-containing protein [Desulfococcaceae bacterium HSG7]|nr:amino acid adenylation domain-containing protein [Desulfococcaceae bacterium HSG7]
MPNDDFLKNYQSLKLPGKEEADSSTFDRIAKYKCLLPLSMTRELLTFSKQKETDSSVLLLSALKILLFRYTSRKNIVIATPHVCDDNSNEADIKIIHTELSADIDFCTFLDIAASSSEKAAVLHSGMNEALCQVMFYHGEDVWAEPSRYPFAIFLNISNTASGLECIWQYRRAYSDFESVERMAGHLNVLLQGIIANPHQYLHQLPILTAAEEKLLIETWNDTSQTYPDDKCIHQLFERQAEKTPEAIAVVFKDEQLAYGELNERSNQLGHYLQKHGVGPETLVGICMERSLEMIIGLLGILKAGGAYVPLEPAYPKERLAFMLEDTQVPVVLTQHKLIKTLPNYQTHLICLDTDWEIISQENTENTANRAHPENMVYVMYTSGSTGEPKGVVIQHQSLTNYLYWVNKNLLNKTVQNLPSISNLTFDASLKQLFAPLLQGDKVWLLPEDIITQPTALLQAISDHAKVGFNCVPSLWATMLYEIDYSQIKLESLTSLFVGGEQFSQEIVDRSIVALPHLKIWNLYGPTEATSNASVAEVLAGGNVTIGRPIANTQIHILDSHLQPVPIGVPGQLYIGGDGLAREYLNRPKLTAENFIANPFSSETKACLYKTGDLARYLPDGNIKFLGRIDHQVKVRGFRIESGEIETVLRQHPAIQETVVTAHEDAPGDKRLVAYVCLAQDQLPISELRILLKQKLPDYMIPSYFIQLDKLPLTANGKVDRKALPDPLKAGTDSGVKYVAPRNKTEKVLADIWQSVLEINKAGVNDNVFDLGVHSLLLMQASARISMALGVSLSLNHFYHYPTITALAKHIDKNSHKATTCVQIQKKAITAPLSLSYTQQGIWLFEQLNPGTAVFHIACAYHIKGDLDVNILSRSVNAIIRRHEALRTVFAIADDVPVQVIKPPFALELICENLQNNKSTEHKTSVQTWIKKKACEPFNLEQGPLIRTALLRIADDEHIFSLTMHHSISDGWSVGVFFKELNALYSSYQSEQPVSLPDLPVQYAHFSIWQREQYNKNEKRLLNYWQSQLKAPLSKLEWPVNNVRQGPRSYSGARCPVKVSKTAAEKLNAVSRQFDATLFMTLLAIYKILLYQLTGQTDMIVGATIANRDSIEIEPLIGLFMNTLVIRTTLSKNLPIKTFIEEVKRIVLNAFIYDKMPFSKLAEVLQTGSADNSLIQTLFLMQTMDNPHIAFPDVTAEKLAVDTGREYADLTLELYDTSEGVNGWFEYSTGLFDEHTISRLAEHFQILAESIGDYPNQRIKELAPFEGNGYPETYLATKISASERHQLLTEWNDTQVDYPLSQSIHQLFEVQVEKTPNAVAVVFEGRSWTYRELNCQANQLARYLRESGIMAGALVGICIKPSLELIVSLLGVLKADSVYVPLDPNYPQERIAFMVEDSKVQMILTLESLTDKIPFQQTPLLCLDKDRDAIRRKSIENPHHLAVPNDLTYVIYTSGSTGKPKAVLGAARGVLNRLYWGWEKLPYEADEVCCQKTSINFVDHVAEIFSPLLKGIPLVMIPDYMRGDILELMDVLSVQKVTRIVLVPSLLKTMLENAPPELALFRQLKYVICSGETLPLTLAEAFYQIISSARLVNLYGSSEVAADVTCCEVNLPSGDAVKTDLEEAIEKDLRSGTIPIGKPISNTQIYILDKYGNLLPPGVIGELYVGGDGLAKGYLNQPELTQKTFILNPFTKNIGNDKTAEVERLFRTGDLARWLPDGNIEFRGRVDHQVKLRGFRIELGEIEAVLRQHETVSEAVVVLHERDDNKFLAAYITKAEVQKTEDNALITELRAWLQKRLPDYMVPASFTVLDELPLTPNGKTDLGALPAPEAVNREQKQSYTAPKDHLEQQLTIIWEKVLKINPVGTHDNFFDLGGNSLAAVMLLNKIGKTFKKKFPPVTLYQAPSVAQFAAILRQKNNTAACRMIEPIPSKAMTGPQLLSHVQQGVWLFEQLNPGTAVFHIACAYHIKGDLDVNILSRSVNAIIRRHEALRTVFTIVDDVPVQIIKPPFALKLTCENFQNNKKTDHQTGVQIWIKKKACEPFNLEQGPLIRTALLRIADDEHIFSLTMHHSISDGWSVGVFFKELNALYSSYQSEQPVSLPDLPVQYTHFTVWQRKRYEKNEKRLLNYWKNKLEAPLPKLEWPVENVRQDSRFYNGARCAIKVSQTSAEKLRVVSRQVDATLFMTLLAVYKILLYQFTGQTDLIVGAAIANRNSIEIEPLIGLFMNTLVMRTNLSENLPVNVFIEEVKQVVLEAFTYDEAPYSKIAEMLQMNSMHDSLIQTLFLMQTMDNPHIAFPDLTAEKLVVDTGREYADLTLELYDTSEGINGWFEYSTDLFDEHTISQLANYFQILAESIGDYPNQRINELSPSVSEWHYLLAEWNDTQVDYPLSQSIHLLFEEQVEKTSDAVAVVFEGRPWTYLELNSQANQLARYLRESGIGAGALVGICIKPSLELIVSLLGVLKADSVYVPLDPNYPQERIAFMVEDSKVQVILTIESLTDKITSRQTPLICLDKDRDAIRRKSIENPNHLTAPNDLAYVIYTSGSTGKPKAVLGAARGVLNRLYWGWVKLPYEADEVCCQKTSINFVDHVAEIFSPLLKGIPLIVIPDYMRGDILELMDVLSVQKVTRIVLVPSLLKTMLENAPPELALFRQLKYVICSGEALPLTLAEAFYQRISSARLVNLYGSSEVAADITCFEVNLPLKDAVKTDLEEVIEKELRSGTIPIGKPISNTQIYILDKYGNLLPPGTIGELYVGGDGLAKGYLNQPELTQKTFISNPFTKNNENNKTAEVEKLFRTGDLARWLPDGNIEFRGRVDHQVKLRGFRIELGEIEAVLSQYETISEAVAVLHERDDNKFLAAYIIKSEVQKTEDSVLISELRAWLQKRLPDYMIPTSFTVLDELPLTPNGKTDRNALPDPEAVNQEQKQSYTAPRDSLEQQLTIIWEKVLKINPVGTHDNFFDLGGNSLAAVMLLNKIGKMFKKKLPPVTLYQAPSVAQFAAVLRQENYEIAWKIIEQIQLYGDRPPFFFIGSRERAKALAPLLGSKQPFFRLNILGFQLKKDSSIQLREVAKRAYIEIRAIQPEGPYFFGAYCYNAALAIEIAQLLHTDKQRVAFMGVFDLFWRRKSRYFDLERHCLNLSEFGFKYMIGKIKAKINIFQERRFVARIRQQAKLCSDAGKPIPRKLADILSFEKVNATFQPSAIKRYEGRITHFMASEWRVSHSPLLGKAATDGVEVHIIDGCHDNLFFEPQVIQLGQQLRICLDREQSVERNTQL